MQNEQRLERVKDWGAMEGKTIVRAFVAPQGERAERADVVLVFSDQTWAAVLATGCEDAEVQVDAYPARDLAIDELLSTDQLYLAGLVNATQKAFIEQRKAERVKREDSARRQREIASLRTRLASLEAAEVSRA